MRMREESGLTLVELLVALAISALLTSLAGTALRLFLTTSQAGSDQLVVLSDQRTSSFWLARDAQMTPPTGVDVSPGTLTLTWRETITDGVHQSVYSQSSENLLRVHSYEGMTSTIPVARHLAPAGFSAWLEGELLTVVITSTRGGASRSWSELTHLRSHGQATP